MAVLLYAGIAAGCLLAGRILIHYFQLESYQFPGYFRTLRRNILKAVMPGVLMTALFVVSFAAMSVIANCFSSSKVVACFHSAGLFAIWPFADVAVAMQASVPPQMQ